MQEPFKSLPLIWTIHEKTLAIHSRQYPSNGQLELVNEWKRVFNRATVVVFPDYVLPVITHIDCIHLFRHFLILKAINIMVISIQDSCIYVSSGTNICSAFGLVLKSGLIPNDFFLSVLSTDNILCI